jgi:beta-lactamase class A
MIPQAPIPQTTTHTIVQQVQASQAESPLRKSELRALLLAAISQNEAQNIKTGVLVTNARGKRVLSHNRTTKHFAASINKVPIALLVLEDLRAGRLSLNQTITWQPSDLRGGFGDYDQPGAPIQATLRQALQDMLNKSGNTVVRAIVNYQLGGPAAVNDRFAAQDLPNTTLTVLSPTSFYLGDSTPEDALHALQKLVAKQDRYSRFMQNAMATNIFEDFGVRSQLQDKNLVLINKIGLLDDPDGNNRHDVGLVYNKKTGNSYGYSFFTTAPFESTDATARAEQSLKDMGVGVLRYSGNKHYAARFKNKLFRSDHPEHRVRY